MRQENLPDVLSLQEFIRGNFQPLPSKYKIYMQAYTFQAFLQYGSGPSFREQLSQSFAI
jgi:hypothetical protein